MVNSNAVRYCVDLSMGIAFLICFVTGLFKFTLLLRMLGLTSLVMPVALMSDIHDWSGIVLGMLVAAHLLINRRWIVAMSRKVLRRVPP